MRYDDVDFRFLKNKEDMTLRGQVLVQKAGMVLSIRHGGVTPYLIAGKPSKHWFEGSNAQGARVDAKWALVDTIYVGTWTEDGTKYLFSFEINNVAQDGP